VISSHFPPPKTINGRNILNVYEWFTELPDTVQFLCAIPPAMRRSWAQQMQRLLSPTGTLVCLEFPLYKNLDAIGPAWGLNGVYWNLLAKGGDGLLRQADLHGQEQVVQQRPFKRVLYYKPDQSYDHGRGTDMISVWRLS